MHPEADLIIQNAKIFDGSGDPPWTGDVLIHEGRIVELGVGLAASRARRCIDATGLWLMPGLIDIHTHYDLEVELAPALPESVRHGTTTIVMSNCSLGLAFGAQRSAGQNIDPIVDCFARVENMPKHVLKKAADLAVWCDSRAYLEHLDELPLGPNVVPMIPHSMLRIEAMGFQDSVSRDPYPDELHRMRELLRQGLEEGYAGFSTDALPFHYLANDPNRHRKIPTQYAHYSEIKALTSVVRELDRVWQATPPKDDRLATIKTLLLTSGRFFGRPLRTTVVAALDIATNRSIVRLALLLAGVLNSRLIRGRFALQALAASFKVWSDGAITPIAEEIPELRALNELDLEDRDGRRRILNDPAFVQRFRTMWYAGKTGFGLARLRRLLRLEDYAISRRLSDMTIDRCPVADWQGRTLADIYARLQAFAKSGTRTIPSAKQDVDISNERAVFASFPNPACDEAEFLIHLLKIFDTDLVWYTVTANQDPKTVRWLIMHPLLLPGFNDSGAHLTNMAFYDGNLRALKLALNATNPRDAASARELARRDRDVAYMVRRLTRDPAELFNIDAGSLAVGRRADLIIIDPAALAQYDGEARVERVYRAEFEHEQLVNRSEGVVHTSIIGGKIAWEKNAFAKALGREPFGRRLAPGRKDDENTTMRRGSELIAHGAGAN